MESSSASDRRRRLARERLQRCHLADLKLFFPLAFSHSRSPAYVRSYMHCTPCDNALLVTMQIFVVVLETGFSQPTIRVCPFCFCLQCHVFSIALREAFLRMRIPNIIIIARDL